MAGLPEVGVEPAPPAERGSDAEPEAQVEPDPPAEAGFCAGAEVLWAATVREPALDVAVVDVLGLWVVAL